MLDRTLHAALKPLLARVAVGLVRLGLSANALSFIGFGLGLAAATAAAFMPAGPPPTTSTSNGAFAAIFSAARATAPVSSLATICARSIRPDPNGWPLRNTVGTAMIWRRSTSSLNSAPSMATWVIAGLSAAMMFSACTTSGQFWQVSEKNVSKCSGPDSART
mgnify:CR=1 FL=1